MLATRWASSKALQEILEDRPLDRNVFKLHEQQKRSGAGVGVDDNDDELLAFAALNDDATSAAVLYDFGFCNRVLDVAIRAELQVESLRLLAPALRSRKFLKLAGTH